MRTDVRIHAQDEDRSPCSGTAFKKKYGIKVTEANPEGSSQDEVNAVKQF
jgi:hypothetical protein